MIRINLLGEKVDRTFSYVLQGLGYFSAVFLMVGVCFLFQGEIENQHFALKNEEASLRQRLARLEKVTKEIDDLEIKKKTLREKLQTISLLKAKKHGPVHILDDINLALPDRAWLTTLKEKSGLLEVTGIALDHQTVASFMNNLTQKRYFGTPDLVLSTEYIKDNVKLQQFSLSVPLQDPLKAKASASEAAPVAPGVVTTAVPTTAAPTTTESPADTTTTSMPITQPS